LRPPRRLKTKRWTNSKAEAEKASEGQQAKLYAEIAEKLVEAADQQFTNGNAIAGHATIQELLQYATKSRDRAISTRKKMKEAEIILSQYATTSGKPESARSPRKTGRRSKTRKRSWPSSARNILDAMFAPKKENK